jgi:hypothetical protein
MYKCYICETDLSETNSSDEHIILNALGGRLKSKYLLCEDCNKEIGDQIDSELAEQLNFYANFLNIKRGRGKPQTVMGVNEATGEKWFFEPGGKPVMYKPDIKKEMNNDGDILHLTIKARDKSELRQILNGLKRTYKIINPDELTEKYEVRSEYLDHHTHFSLTFGGVTGFRSICKSAINFYILKTNDRISIVHLIPFIKSQEDKHIVWTFYPKIDVILNRNKDEILHSIIIKGIKSDKLLYAYIEYFDAIKFIVLLNDEYNNEDCEFSYFFDVLTGMESPKNYELNLNKDSISEILRNRTIDYDKVKMDQIELLSKIGKRQVDDQISHITSEAIDKIFKKYPEGCEITDEMITEFAHEVAENFTKFAFRGKHK